MLRGKWLLKGFQLQTVQDCCEFDPPRSNIKTWFIAVPLHHEPFSPEAGAELHPHSD